MQKYALAIPAIAFGVCVIAPSVFAAFATLLTVLLDMAAELAVPVAFFLTVGFIIFALARKGNT